MYSSSSGGFPISVVEADVQNFDASESRSRFLFANGYGSRAFGDAQLIGYDAASKTATVLGALPGSVDFGTDFVLAGAMGGPGSFMTGFGARSSGGTIQETGAKVFSFDFGSASSLKYTSTTQ